MQRAYRWLFLALPHNKTAFFCMWVGKRVTQKKIKKTVQLSETTQFVNGFQKYCFLNPLFSAVVMLLTCSTRFIQLELDWPHMFVAVKMWWTLYKICNCLLSACQESWKLNKWALYLTQVWIIDETWSQQLFGYMLAMLDGKVIVRNGSFYTTWSAKYLVHGVICVQQSILKSIYYVHYDGSVH